MLIHFRNTMVATEICHAGAADLRCSNKQVKKTACKPSGLI